MASKLRGHVTDFGDVLRVEQWIVKGRRHHQLVWRLGAIADTTPADRVVRGIAYPSTGKRDLIMDLQADKKVPLSIGWTDEVGNPTSAVGLLPHRAESDHRIVLDDGPPHGVGRDLGEVVAAVGPQLVVLLGGQHAEQPITVGMLGRQLRDRHRDSLTARAER